VPLVPLVLTQGAQQNSNAPNVKLGGKKETLFDSTVYSLNLVIFLQVLHTTGNTDLCYYNYLCSHPLWILSDFNHVYSNIGYIMLGVLFIFLVYRRNRMHQRRMLDNDELEVRNSILCIFGRCPNFYLFILVLLLFKILCIVCVELWNPSSLRPLLCHGIGADYGRDSECLLPRLPKRIQFSIW
jgi:hypothetical protein